MKTPTAFRTHLAMLGQRVLDGRATHQEAVALLVNWSLTNARPVVRDVYQAWADRQVTGWLNARAAERERSPQEQALFDLFGDVPTRIEIAPGRFRDLTGATRGDLQAWRRQARVKRANVTAFADFVEQVSAELERRLTDDAMTVADALQAAPARPSNLTTEV